VNFMAILVAYVNFLWQTFQVDIWVFSQWWMYAPLCIPVIGYLVFFCIKWFVITLPVWYIPAKIFGASPLGVFGTAIKKLNDDRNEKKNKKTD
jgi:hypothetical protein